MKRVNERRKKRRYEKGRDKGKGEKRRKDAGRYKRMNEWNK